ncbi:MAG: hypothetical protein OXH81_10630 [Gemmatimonadetes bacterium]|nr:hypothetical protein [Gemmatimonadota bacterium]MDE2733616.1 hypothetical protein [Gemmatimonadota bacterium]
MSQSYETYKPKLSPTWWLKSRSYFLFMMRELSSVFIAAFVLLFLYQLFALAKGPEAYAACRSALTTPGFVVFYVVAFVFALYHTITWLGVMGRVQVVQMGAFTVPPKLVTAGAFVGFFLVSVAVGCIFLYAL